MPASERKQSASVGARRRVECGANGGVASSRKLRKKAGPLRGRRIKGGRSGGIRQKRAAFASRTTTTYNNNSHFH